MRQMWSKEEIETQKKDISTLVDSKGNPRFIEGDGEGLTQEGVTITYCKWSLSGTHLMLVCAGTVENTTALSNADNIAEYTLPNYIFDKIYPVWSNNIEQKTVQLYASDWTTQTITCRTRKLTSTIVISNGTNLTLTADRNFRVQFDLLIDSE